MVILFDSSLDIDTTDKEMIKRILYKICCCPYICSFDYDFSMCKGIHFRLKCFIKCDKCRLVFDDFRRFAYDQFRPKWARNILFDKKEMLRDAT